MKQGHNERAPSLTIELHVALSVVNREATVRETANSEQVKLCQYLCKTLSSNAGTAVAPSLIEQQLSACEILASHVSHVTAAHSKQC